MTSRFYETIFAAGEKPVGWELVGRLNSRIGYLRTLTMRSKGRNLAGPKNLEAIVLAIQRRDASGAVAACRAHIGEARSIALPDYRIEIGLIVLERGVDMARSRARNARNLAAHTDIAKLVFDRTFERLRNLGDRQRCSVVALPLARYEPVGVG